MKGFLPISKAETQGNQLDFVYVSGDAYVDHPTFGHALVSRLIQSQGFSIGIIAQPQTDADYLEFGEPKYGFVVGSGVVDSMVNNYTANKRKRSTDVYSAGGKLNRPDRALTVYCKKLKELFPDTAIIIGGIEASLRRFAHYDYWSDSVMPSILVDTGADLLIFGMGENPFLQLMEYARKGIPLKKVRDVRGCCFLDTLENLPKTLQEKIKNQENLILLPSLSEVSSDKVSYAKAFRVQEQNTDSINSKVLVQKQKDNKYLVQNLPQLPLTQQQMDFVYNLPYQRTFHPIYQPLGGVDAIKEVQFSLVSQRGCFGSCNFCALTYHQGRVIQNRSHQNIIDEAVQLTDMPDFKGYIHDVGGPTANFRDVACDKQKQHGVCPDKTCIGFKPCKNLKVSHKDYLELLQKLRKLPKVKKVFVRSGIRFDYLMMDKDTQFFNELVKHHISGQLKVAPEHAADNTLKAMNKPTFSVYKKFTEQFRDINLRLKMPQYVVPYLIASHPNCTIKDMIELACYLKSINYMPEQVQDFYPTPSTKSTTMYYTGLNPDDLTPVHVPKSVEERQMQRALMQWRKKENYVLVKKALIMSGRQDLIGFGEHCLIKPLKQELAQKANVRTKPKKPYAHSKKKPRKKSIKKTLDEKK